MVHKLVLFLHNNNKHQEKDLINSLRQQGHWGSIGNERSPTLTFSEEE